MMYTSFTVEEYNLLSDKYKKKVVGIQECGQVMKVPLCPECTGPMMETEDHQYLSCIECGCIRKLRKLK